MIGQSISKTQKGPFLEPLLCSRINSRIDSTPAAVTTVVDRSTATAVAVAAAAAATATAAAKQQQLQR